MQSDDLVGLIHSVVEQKCETQNIELKSAHEGTPTKLFGTLSAFCNQEEGGVIIFGIDEQNDFTIVGVYDPQDLQQRVTEQCKQMEPNVRPLFTVAKINNTYLVSAEIPSIDISQRPVFYKGTGRVRGSYVRVGDADEHMSEYEIYSYEAYRKRILDDLRPVEGASLELIDDALLQDYLSAITRDRRNLVTRVTDEKVLELMGVVKNGILTLSGVMVFSLYPQGFFPQLSITAVALPGITLGETSSKGERFIDSQRITGSIPTMLEDAVDFVRRNSRVSTIIDRDGTRRDEPEYPMIAVREAILNSLVHRDYSIHSENVPIRVEMYRDRIEIKNSGGLYGRVTVDSLGKVRPETRNASLANMLELLGITENRYSGIPTIRAELRDANMPDPVFLSRSGDFVTIFKNNISGSELTSSLNGDNQADSIVELCKVPRSRLEISDFVGKTQYYTVKTVINPLLEKGLLHLTVPDKPKSKNQRYVSRLR